MQVIKKKCKIRELIQYTFFFNFQNTAKKSSRNTYAPTPISLFQVLDILSNFMASCYDSRVACRLSFLFFISLGNGRSHADQTVVMHQYSTGVVISSIMVQERISDPNYLVEVDYDASL